jgi:nucleoid DNA-binding protein
MTQEQFELNMVTLLELPRKTVQMLIAQFVNRFTHRIHTGDLVVLTGIGQFFVARRSTRNYYDVHTGIVHSFPARNVPKMRFTGTALQGINTDWRTWYAYSQTIESADNRLAQEMSLLYGTDLLSCNRFIWALAQVINAAIAANDSVTIQNWGKIYRTTKAARSKFNVKTLSGHTIYPATVYTRWRPAEALRKSVN